MQIPILSEIWGLLKSDHFGIEIIAGAVQTSSLKKDLNLKLELVMLNLQRNNLKEILLQVREPSTIIIRGLLISIPNGWMRIQMLAWQI